MIRSQKEFFEKYNEEDLVVFKQDCITHSKKFVMHCWNISKKLCETLMHKLNLRGPKYSFRWYTDGTSDFQIASCDPVPSNLVEGRTNFGPGTKDTFWITDGTTNKLIHTDENIPNGFYKGSTSHSTLGYKIMNNGFESRWFGPLDVIPDDFTNYGRLLNENENYKVAAYKRKKIWINDGTNQIKVSLASGVPSGYVIGKLPKKSTRDKIEERNAYYDSLGYIPVGKLSKKQLTAYAYYRDHGYDLDVISKPDVYTYINKKHILLFDQYGAENHSKGVSNEEKEFAAWVKSIYNGTIITNTKSILKSNDKYYELDIYIPEKSVGLEYNGSYFHSNLFKDKQYHFKKSKLADDLGIRLIQVYDYEWKSPTKRPIIESMIKLALGIIDIKIYARQCKVKEISNKDAKPFNDRNHLQGHRNAQVTLGLFYKDELVQLMSFSKTKYNRNLKSDNSWEIIRGCPGSNNIVVGGVSKLLNYFIKLYHPKQIFSYCDFNKFDGRSYIAAGMHFIGYTGPDKRWIVNGIVVNRNPKRYGELKNNSEAIIWGSGSKKFELVYN